jgi:hypothetical protein
MPTQNKTLDKSKADLTVPVTAGYNITDSCYSSCIHQPRGIQQIPYTSAKVQCQDVQIAKTALVMWTLRFYVLISTELGTLPDISTSRGVFFYISTLLGKPDLFCVFSIAYAHTCMQRACMYNVLLCFRRESSLAASSPRVSSRSFSSFTTVILRLYSDSDSSGWSRCRPNSDPTWWRVGE